MRRPWSLTAGEWDATVIRTALLCAEPGDSAASVGGAEVEKAPGADFRYTTWETAQKPALDHREGSVP